MKFTLTDWKHSTAFAGQTFDGPANLNLSQWISCLNRIIETAWEQVLRPFFAEHECGWPTAETLRNHGRWLIPHPSQTKGLGHRLFQWRGQIVFEGCSQQGERGSSYVIHPHTATTPKPWETEAKHRVGVGVGGREG